MARTPSKDPSIPVHTSLPKSLKAALEEKWMDRETGKVPVGKYRQLLIQAAKNYLRCFDKQKRRKEDM